MTGSGSSGKLDGPGCAWSLDGLADDVPAVAWAAGADG
jgi:hypothetical protein